MPHLRPIFLLTFGLGAFACDKDKGSQGAPPPPPPPASATAASAGACNGGGGQNGDPVSAPFFPRTAASFCLDPQGEAKTYGEKGKLTLDDVCTQAFDGECEVYKRFALKRVVSLRYVDGAGKGGTVEINLSQFADVGGGYGMFTKRVVADSDPSRSDAAKPLAAGAGAALGTGTAYVWRGQHLVELSYLNENETQEQMAKSGEAILGVLAKEIGERLPGSTEKPPSARALPQASLLANGVQFYPKDPMGWANVGPGAVGFYKEGDKRWRAVAIQRDDAEQAKDAFKTIKSRPGSLPVAGVGDDAVTLTVADTKAEWVVARKGALVLGIGDEDLVKEPGARVAKDEKVAKLKAQLAASPK